MNYATKFSMLLALLFTTATAMAQFNVTGNVTDGSGEPLIGVSIIVKGSTTGTVTDFNGDFNLNVKGERAVLLFSYTGFASQEIEATPDNNRLNVTLEEDIADLEEVVVTGLASGVKRSNLANNVSTISSQELTEVTTQQTIDGALYGKMTGVNIISSSGAPGGGIAMRLRGISSLTGNNQPLFIIDGVYISNAEIPSGLRFASGANSGSEENASNRLADLNPEDIESIEVLKGASAAAIYGTRANAGVVIITTKQGQAGKTKVRFEQDFGVNTIQRFVGRRQYTAAEVEEAFGPDERARFERAVADGEVFDYEQEIYGNDGFITDSRMSISGGNEKTTFYFNTSYRDEEGIIENTGFERFSMRLNVDHRISDKIKMGVNANYINSFASRSFTGNENEGGLSYGYNLAFTRDWVNLFPDALGNYPTNPNAAGNPIFVRDNTWNEERNNRFISGANMEVNLYQTDRTIFKLTGNVGVDFLMNETSVYVPETHQAQAGGNNGFIGEGRNGLLNYNYQAFAVLDHYTESNINFNTQIGMTYLNFDRDLVLNRATQLIPGQTNLQNSGAQQISQARATEEDFGIVAQEQVNWDDKIIGTVGIRFDKSSLNGDPNQFFAFPRASLAVNVANFDFWSINSMNQFKLRVAYGETGSSASFGSLFTTLASTNIGGQVGIRAGGSLGNPNLEPETSQELEFGADFGILNNKLNLGVTYYIRDVENLLYDFDIPSSTGWADESRSDFDLRNQGLEVQLGFTPVNREKFQWNSTVNYWYNRSEVTRLGVPPFVPTGVAFGLGLGTFFVEEGEPITQLKGNGAEGPVTIGDVEPDFQLGWFNQIKIGNNIDFTFLTHWKEGGDVLNLSRLLTNLGGTTPEEYADLVGFVEDASYFRLREVGLYYTLPKFSNTISRLRVGVSGRNLLTLTDYSSYDPEVSTKGTTGLSTGIEVTPFPSTRQAYFHVTAEF
ncbi:SusC/RagA family TonB-linked outer membrane protein [Phaeodactylibacter xiamenensis]|jgi:TonB-linked SusC/RagA family outer membrane protein|uniref:SusC/RagA family TonB-linked outer membrane protein n=1 Tax=Phaeodactylibacter xiamenensis TaxID=1524460 RepID=UPI0024A9F420|nr:SusC/RagA family TonB-linked outer membrane protein [Phaeodactylibacter xiamenensis]